MAVETTLAGGFPKIGGATDEQKLRRALHQFDKGELSEEELEGVKNEVTEEVLRFENEAGIDIVTDGLIRWDDAITYPARKIAGFEIGGLIRYFDTNTFYRRTTVESRLEAPKSLAADDFKFAQAKSAKPVKAVLTGPFTLAKLSFNQFYREETQMIYDLAHIFHQEVKHLEEAGCKYIQFDEPALLQHKQDWKTFLKVYEVVAAETSKAEKTIFFNFGSIEGIYPNVLDLPVDRIGLDLTRGHRNWDVIRGTKFSRKLAAGILEARNTKMESEAETAQLLGELAEIANMDQLWISHNYSLEFLPRASAKKKTELLVKAARQFNGLAKQGESIKGAGVSS